MSGDELVQLLREVFPEGPVPEAKQAALAGIHPGELNGLLGRSWMKALKDGTYLDPFDSFMLRDVGLRYYLPFFVAYTVLHPETNYPWMLPKLIVDRASVLRGEGGIDDEQRRAVLRCLTFLEEQMFADFCVDELDPISQADLRDVRHALEALSDLHL